MLTPILKEIKNDLEEKEKLSDYEKNLLNELRFVKNNFNFSEKKALNENVRMGLKPRQQFCPCCGN